MSRAEAQARYLAALAARAYSEEQMRRVAGANIVDGGGVAELERSLEELPADQLKALIQSMATNPATPGEDSLASSLPAGRACPARLTSGPFGAEGESQRKCPTCGASWWTQIGTRTSPRAGGRASPDRGSPSSSPRQAAGSAPSLPRPTPGGAAARAARTSQPGGHRRAPARLRPHRLDRNGTGERVAMDALAGCREMRCPWRGDPQHCPWHSAECDQAW